MRWVFSFVVLIGLAIGTIRYGIPAVKNSQLESEVTDNVRNYIVHPNGDLQDKLQDVVSQQDCKLDDESLDIRFGEEGSEISVSFDYWRTANFFFYKMPVRYSFSNTVSAKALTDVKNKLDDSMQKSTDRVKNALQQQ